MGERRPRLLLRGGRVVDPANACDAERDVLIENGAVLACGPALDPGDATVIDCKGMIVAPGFVDLHAHLRVPGFEYKESLETGSAAAAAGGFTSVCCMPNTRPVLDTPEAVSNLLAEIAARSTIRIRPIGAISRDREGLEPVDFAALAEAGVVGFSDDGDSTRDSGVMVAALQASRQLRLPVMVHCEDWGLVGGVMHEGNVSRELNVKGLPAAAEEIILARDLMLAEMTGGWLHVLHVSTARGVELIRCAKARGVHVTAEVMPHHLLMTDEWFAGRRTFVNCDADPGMPVSSPNALAKVNPPLRPKADTEALLAAVRDGTFDIVATDHAPHTMEEKVEIPIDQAAFGMSGFEPALPLMLSLVRAGNLSLGGMVRLMSTEPAKLMRWSAGSLTAGNPADIVVFDPDREWTITPETLRTKSPNTPLLGMQVHGKVNRTFVGGAQVHAA